MKVFLVWRFYGEFVYNGLVVFVFILSAGVGSSYEDEVSRSERVTVYSELY